MAQVFTKDAVEQYFGFLRRDILYENPYVHPLDPDPDTAHPNADLLTRILGTNAYISYDDFRKLLSYQGIMTEEEQRALKDLEVVSGAFGRAVDGLYNQSQRDAQTFFGKFPQLLKPYTDFSTSTVPFGERFGDLLTALLPELKPGLKNRFIRQTLAEAFRADEALVDALLFDPAVLPALKDSVLQAADDFLAAEELGNAETSLSSYRTQLEVPASGNWNFYLETDAPSPVLLIDGRIIPLTAPGSGVFQNSSAVQLLAGRLYPVDLRLTEATGPSVLSWASTGQAKAPIPGKYLYPEETFGPLRSAILRLFIIVRLCEKLKISASEAAFFGRHEHWQIAGKSLWSSISGTGIPPTADLSATLRGILDLQGYHKIKKELQVEGDELLEVFEDPDKQVETAPGRYESLLYLLTGWG